VAQFHHTHLPVPPHSPTNSATLTYQFRHTHLPIPPHSPINSATLTYQFHHTHLPVPPHSPTNSTTLTYQTFNHQCLIFQSVFTQTCGIYPILGPGTPLPLDPGLPPSTQASPELNCLRPTTQLSNVVFPHPLAPSRP
jgi:hypothetical protein